MSLLFFSQTTQRTDSSLFMADSGDGGPLSLDSAHLSPLLTHFLLFLQESTPSSCRTVSPSFSRSASTRPDFPPSDFPILGAFQIVDPANQTLALDSWSAINGTAISVVNNTEGVSSALTNSLQVEVVDGSAAFANSGYWGQSSRHMSCSVLDLC